MIQKEAMFPVLDDGFIRVVDILGDDQAIVDTARVSIGSQKATSSTKDLIRYMMRHRHSSPFEFAVLILHLRLPIDVARQWWRHRTASLSERSTRYSIQDTSAQRVLPGEWRLQSKDAKQGSEGLLDEDQGQILSETEEKLQEAAYSFYQQAIGFGVAREQARKNLPLCHYTEAFWKIDLHNLLHFLSLRMDDHAQEEIRQYANIIGEKIVAEWCPLTWEAFRDFRLNAVTLSQKEIQAIQARNDDVLLFQLYEQFGWLTPDGVSLNTRKGEVNEYLSKMETLCLLD